MNNTRRKKLEKAIELLNNAEEIIRRCSEEEQEYAYNMPENMQYISKKHGDAIENAEAMDAHADEILNIIEELQEM